MTSRTPTTPSALNCSHWAPAHHRLGEEFRYSLCDRDEAPGALQRVRGARTRGVLARFSLDTPGRDGVPPVRMMSFSWLAVRRMQRLALQVRRCS